MYKNQRDSELKRQQPENNEKNQLKRIPKDPILLQTSDNPPLDEVYSFFMKLFYYLGIFGFFPYFLLTFSPYELLQSDFNSTRYMIIFTLIALMILLLMDIIGMQTSYFDRISRLLTIIFTIAAGIITIILLVNIQNNSGDSLSFNLTLATLDLGMFCFLGWFFVRSDRGLSPDKTKPLYNTTFWILIYCGSLFLLDFFVNGLFLTGLVISFFAYPIAILIWGKPKVVPQIKSRKLVFPYKRATFYNFTIDAIKAILVITTIIAMSYDGTVILYSNWENSVNHIWIRNLGFVGIFAALAMGVYIRIQNKFYGLLVNIIMFSAAIIQYLLVNTFYFYLWWLIAPLNGIILAGIYYYIEQKIHVSDNISIMPGTFYLIILGILETAILLRQSPEIDDILENIKFTLSLMGIAYIIGYIREAPKQKSLRVSL